MSADQLLSIGLPLLLLALMALGLRALQGTVLAPAVFFTTVWVGYFALGAVGLQIQGQPPGIVGWAVLALIAFFACGAVLMQFASYAQHEDAPVQREQHRVNTSRLLTVTLIFSSLSAYAVPGVLLYAGFGLGDLLRLADPAYLQVIAGVMSNLRYGELADEPLPVRAALGFLYVASLLSGVLAASGATRWQRSAAFAAPLVGVFYTLVTTSKTPLMMALFLFASSWLAEQVRRAPQAKPSLPSTVILPTVLVGVALASYVYFLILVRAGNYQSTQATSEGFRTYFLSHLATLAAWLDRESILPSPLGWGQFSFSGALGRLGLAERTQGIYREVRMPLTGDLTNLFSAFRGLLQDFGAAGSTLLLAALGARSQASYDATRHGSYKAARTMALVYFTALLSFLYSPFIFNNIIAAWVIYWIAIPFLYVPSNAR